MKLIIFLLLTVSAWGQRDIAPPETIKHSGMTVIVGYDKSEWDTTMKWGGDFYIQQSTFGKEPASIHYVRFGNKEEHHFDRELLTLNRLIYFWDTYLAECFADSSQIDVYNDCGMAGCLVIHGYHKEWTHRSPDPFEFIDKYLRKKSKGVVK